MDTAQETIIKQATIAACVLACGDRLALIELTGKPDAVTQGAALIHAGFAYHGLVGIVGGKVQTAANDPLDLEAAFYMGGAARLLGSLVPAPASDGAEWLSRLYQLPDDRTDN